MSSDEMGLTRSEPSGSGIRRRRCGRGFRYLAADSTPVKDEGTLARIKSLVIPPAWEDVWICPDPSGHIQAIGTDSAGRRQYRYHDLWRERRDRAKHDRVVEFGSGLPHLREVVCRDLNGSGLTRARVLAAAIRLIDLGFFRLGGEEYAEENGTFGLATIRKEHVSLVKGQLVFEYQAKGAKHREQAVAEDDVCTVVRSLRRRRKGGERLLAYKSGARWHDVTAADINTYLGEVAGGDYTAKDFRTWHATVLAAVGLAVSESAASSDSQRKRAIARVVREVADYLGNTPAVARASYIDPRVIDRYLHGVTIGPVLGDLGRDSEFGDLATRGHAERAVVKLLAGQRPRRFTDGGPGSNSRHELGSSPHHRGGGRRVEHPEHLLAPRYRAPQAAGRCLGAVRAQPS